MGTQGKLFFRTGKMIIYDITQIALIDSDEGIAWLQAKCCGNAIGGNAANDTASAP
jgi:hypothetical protein